MPGAGTGRVPTQAGGRSPGTDERTRGKGAVAESVGRVDTPTPSRNGQMSTNNRETDRRRDSAKRRNDPRYNRSVTALFFDDSHEIKQIFIARADIKNVQTHARCFENRNKGCMHKILGQMPKKNTRAKLRYLYMYILRQLAASRFDLDMDALF